MHCQNLITSPLVQSASFSLKSLQHPCESKENLQCKVKKYPQTNIQQALPKNCGLLWGELVLLDKQKSLPFLSHRSTRNDRHPPGRGFQAPPPLIIQTTSATTPFVLRAAPAHVDWWTHDPFFFLLSNSPLCLHGPYDFTCKPSPASWHNHSLSCFFFFQWLRQRGGEAVRNSFFLVFLPHRRRGKKKKT